MSNPAENEAEVTVSLTDFSIAETQPPSVDPATLRRAMKYGQKNSARFGNRPFWDCETELRSRWEARGELTEWDWVRGAVQVGYEQGPD